MKKLFPLSFSRLSCFEQCPPKFEYLYVAKTVKDQDNEHTLYGTRVHSGLEAYGRAVAAGEPVTTDDPEWGKFCGLVDRIMQRPGDKFFEYQMAIDAERKPCDWFYADVWLRSIADVLIINGDKAWCGDWKGLPLTTKLPTPQGWTTMGDVAVGDKLFSESGDQCRVVGKSEVKNIRCFEVVFDDTTRVVCDENHLWKAHDGRVTSVQELRPGDKILVASPLALPDAPLPLDPYVLGLWLADGKHTSSEITKPDTFVWEEIVRRGYAVSHDYAERAGKGGCTVRTILGIRGTLKALGVLGNKHIPQAYLRAGYQQRVDLLRGLMDGDGNVNAARKQAIYTTVDRALSDAVCELLCSLGQRPLQSKVTAHGFGKTVAAYPVSFKPLGINPFLVPRKADRVLPDWGSGKSWRRRVVSVEEVPSVPTQCVEVDSADHTFLCTERMVPTHNSGKVKPNPTQLQLFTLMIFLHFPDVQEVTTSFIWLNHDEITSTTYTRRMENALWLALNPRLDAVQEAVDLGVFKAKPSGLCGWCPAKTICPSARRR